MVSKFLLVLDDYWNEKHDDWDVLSLPFRHGNEGSRVIVTTRSTKVSSIVSSFEACSLEHLSDDDCWKLMKQRAFSKVEEREDLEYIGKDIAKKCKGLPLAAKTLGSMLLHCKPIKDEWLSVLKSNLWDLPIEKNDVFPALMLSYLHLPAHLQKCFAYCSIFPQNHEFQAEQLILLWMAEGFIQPIEGRRWEDLGSDYLNELYARSFFKQARNATNQTIYRMHDLIHDMAQLVSADVCFQVKYSMSNCYPLFGNACHLSMLHDSVQPIVLKASQKNKRLRTFLLINNGVATGQVSVDLFTHLHLLRVLDLSCLGLDNLSDSIDNLKYLRYLNLSGNPIPRLPESLCKLVALQTLKLQNCCQFRELPENIKNLSNLRHLELDIKGQLVHMPPHFGNLTSLQSLSACIIRKREGNGIDELKNMNLLRGSLCIKNIKYVSEVKDAFEAKLAMKSCLDKLELQWGQLRVGRDTRDLEQTKNQQALVLANLQPHENLKELVIENYCGMFYPPWFSEPSRKFTTIHLQGLKYCNNLPPLGQLHFLKSFHISDMPCLESIDDSFYGSDNSLKFPLLESFQVRSMPRLIHWRCPGNDVMPCLETFTIHHCQNLTSLPPKLHVLTNISNCPSLQWLP